MPRIFGDLEEIKISKHEIFLDARGDFRELFKFKNLAENFNFNLESAQFNLSRTHKGGLRGIHFSKADHNQSKLVTCISGEIQDIVVDLRPNSKTYRQYNEYLLNSEYGESVLIPPGFGHAFLGKQHSNIVAYITTTLYNPNLEFTISPFDKELNIEWASLKYILSEKDKFAPSLASVEQLIFNGNTI